MTMNQSRMTNNMDVSSLKSHIKLKTIPTFLIFAGPEWKVQEIYLNQIAKVKSCEIKRIDSIADIYTQLRNKSFVRKPVIYVVRDDKELMTNEKLQAQIDSDLLGQDMLILLLTTVDKRTKFYKKYKEAIVEFEPLADAVLKKYIKKEINLTDQNCDILIDVCEHDFGRILLEIDKIKRCMIAGKDEDMPNNIFRMLLANGTIYRPPYDAIFDLVDAILDRKVNRTFDLLQQSYESGEATMVMLSVLYNNAKAVLQVQTYEGDNLSKATGLTGWQIKNAKVHVKKYSDEELVHMLKLIQKVESGIKTGKMEDEFAMQYLLIHIL